MKNPFLQSRIVYGVFVITASLLSSGCAGGWGVKEPLPENDLEYYQINCKKKQEQIVFLESLRMGRDERLINSVENVVNPHQAITNPERVSQRRAVATGRTNWLINQHLMRLAYDCP